MSLHETLMTWPRARLVKELQAQARDNAELRRQSLELEVQIFWMRSAERDGDLASRALAAAVAKFIKAKGRYHTEQGYKELVAAFDEVARETSP